MTGFDFKVLPPPSVNRAFRNVPGKGRVKTRDYRVWRTNAVKAIWAQVRADHRIAGNVAVTVHLPEKMRGDIDNRIKGILDALVQSQRIDDDRHVTALTVRRSSPLKEAIIWVESDLGVGRGVMEVA